MEVEYPIERNGVSVGTTRIIKEGMFLKILCRCDIKYEEGLHIQIIGADKTIDLGLCVPGKFGIELVSRVLIRDLPGSALKIQLSKRGKDEFYPVSPLRPFDGLHMLRNGRFQVRNSVAGIVVVKSM